MKDRPLPIGVVIPTRNVRPALQAHLAQLQTWADLAEEIIVVDSHSTDGTLELLQAELRHPGLRILQHPPGLYQSWNHAIRHVTAKYTYISTIGDTITAEGLQHLAATAEQLRSEVLISAPALVDVAGQPVTERRWPIHKLLDWYPLEQPVRLEPWQVFLLTTLHCPDSILGSSASDLYLTETLKRFPFPTDYGHAGDTAWGLAYGWRVVLAITPKLFSRFVLHPNDATLPPAAEARRMGRFYDLEDQKTAEFLKTPASAASQETQPSIAEIVTAIQKLHQSQRRYWAARHEFWPWIVNPGAWRARAKRNHEREHLCQVKERICRNLELPSERASGSGAQPGARPPNNGPEHLTRGILGFIGNLPT
jgi:hypothetical protein